VDSSLGADSAHDLPVFNFPNPHTLTNIEEIPYNNRLVPNSYVALTIRDTSWIGHLAYMDHDNVLHFMHVFDGKKDYQPFTKYETISIPLDQITKHKPVRQTIRMILDEFAITLQQIMHTTINDPSNAVTEIDEAMYDIIILITAHGTLNHSSFPINPDDTVSIIRYAEHGYGCTMMNDTRFIASLKGTLHVTENKLIHTFNALQAAKLGTTSPYEIYNDTDISAKSQFAPDAKRLYDVVYSNDTNKMKDDIPEYKGNRLSHYGVYTMYSTRTEYPVSERMPPFGNNGRSFTLRDVYKGLHDLNFKNIGIIEYACNSADKKIRRPDNAYGGTKRHFR
jgi:hypothetical protein